MSGKKLGKAFETILREYFTKKALSEKALKSVEITETNFEPWKFGTMKFVNGEYKLVERPPDYEVQGYGDGGSIYDADGNELLGCSEYDVFSCPEIVKMILGIPDMMNQIQRLLKSHNETLKALEIAWQFIHNGIETGFICLPDAPDPAVETPEIIQKAIRMARKMK